MGLRKYETSGRLGEDAYVLEKTMSGRSPPPREGKCKRGVMMKRIQSIPRPRAPEVKRRGNGRIGTWDGWARTPRAPWTAASTH
jgi:hypothetical protein